MLILQHTIVSDSKLMADFQRAPEVSQANRQANGKSIKETKPASTSAEVILFHGGCIV